MDGTAMTGEHRFDETDVTLLDALHLDPRASFATLGPALGMSAVTAARRWQHLSESGQAWVSSVPGPELAVVFATYEVRVHPGYVGEVTGALAELPQAASVYVTDGATDVHCLIFAADMTALNYLLLERLPRIPHISSAQAHIGLTWHSSIHWQLGAMEADQRAAVAEAASNGRDFPRPRARHRRPTADERALFVALQRDGRARLRDLAGELAVSEHVVRRRMESLQRRGMLGFRTDFVRGDGGWPVAFILWLAVPPAELDEVGRRVSAWPATRICVSSVGRTNMMVLQQVHQVADVTDVLKRFAREVPTAEVTDHRLVLRAVKSWGRLLDSEGRAVATVPVDPWAPVSD